MAWTSDDAERELTRIDAEVLRLQRAAASIRDVIRYMASVAALATAAPAPVKRDDPTDDPRDADSADGEEALPAEDDEPLRVADRIVRALSVSMAPELVTPSDAKALLDQQPGKPVPLQTVNNTLVRRTDLFVRLDKGRYKLRPTPAAPGDDVDGPVTDRTEGEPRSRRILAFLASKGGTGNVGDLTQSLAAGEGIDHGNQRDMSAMRQKIRGSLSNLKTAGYVVDQGDNSGVWRLTDKAVDAITAPTGISRASRVDAERMGSELPP